MSANIRRLNPPTLRDCSEFGFSQISVVEPGRMAYFSGMAAMYPDGSLCTGALEEQTEVTLQNCANALASIEAQPKDIAMFRFYVVEMSTEAMTVVLPMIQKFLDGAMPSMCGLGVQALAVPEFRIGVELVVRVPDRRRPATALDDGGAV